MNHCSHVAAYWHEMANWNWEWGTDLGFTFSFDREVYYLRISR